MNNKPTLYRKRLIPMETIELKDDEILVLNDDVIVTKWNVLKPRKDFTKGFSCYFLQKGYKISKFLDNDGKLVYYYCDIIDYKYLQESNTYIFTDLLADVIIYENGFVKVVDLCEISRAVEEGSMTLDMVKNALDSLDELLNTIYDGKLKSLIEEYF